MKLPTMDIELSNQNVLIICGTVTAGVAIISVIRRLKRKSNKPNNPKDTVIMNHPGRGPYAPSFVPYAVKLETFLRISKVPYKAVDSINMGPKGKLPWVEYNDQVLADTSFIIKFINKEFNVNIDKGFQSKDLAAAYALQKMIEENTYWITVYDRWLSDTGHYRNIMKEFKLPWIAGLFLRRSLRQYMHGHGIGRHNKEELFEIFRDDLNALSQFLGDKKYLLGDQPCQADCAVFGQLSQIYWQCWGTRAEKTLGEFPNLCQYCDRIKETYWPDWDKCTTKDWDKRVC